MLSFTFSRCRGGCGWWNFIILGSSNILNLDCPRRNLLAAGWHQNRIHWTSVNIYILDWSCQRNRHT
jgi:hypothetical protein